MIQICSNMILGIDVVFIHAKDPVKLSNWYRDTLEIEIGFQTTDFSWQEYNLPARGLQTRFAIDYGGENPSDVEKQPIMISFKVDNIHNAIEKLENKGIEFFGKNKIHDVGPTLIATFQDIEGNWIQISQRNE